MKNFVRFTIKAKAFRSFRDEVNFEIRPLTLLYGFNQAGKSTLLRLMPILAQSIYHAGPLDLSCPAAGGVSLKKMSWLGRSPIFSPKISIEASRIPSRPTMTIQLADDGGMIVNRMKIFNESKELFSADYQRKSGNKTTASYIGTFEGKEWEGSLTFSTMFPVGLPESAEKIINEIKSAINPIKRIQWLQANRLFKQNTKQSLCCCPDGSDLPALLRGPELQNVAKKISIWLERQEGLGSGISLRQDTQGHWEFVHSAEGREDLPLHLAGEGIRSLLPVILCAFWAKNGGSSAPSICSGGT